MPKRRLSVERLEDRALMAGDLGSFPPALLSNIDEVAEIDDLVSANAEVVAAQFGTTSSPSSVRLPFGPDYQTFRQCGDLQCLIVPKLLAAATRPDGTVRLVGSSANINPSRLTVTDVNAQGEILRQFELPDALLVNPFSGIGSAVSLSPNGQWLAIGNALFNIDDAAAPQLIPRPDDVPVGAELIGRVANDGRAVISWNGQSYAWDSVTGFHRLDSLFSDSPNANSILLQANAHAISPEGNVVVGNSGGNGDYGHATAWNPSVSDVSAPFALPDRGRPSNAFAVSGNGHVIGGEIRGIGAVVWIDERFKALVDQNGDFVPGSVTSIVTSLDNGEGSWAAFGTAAGEPFIALSDGVAYPLATWLAEEYGIELSGNSLMKAFYHEGALSLITAQYEQFTCSPDPIDCASIPPTQLAAHLITVPFTGHIQHSSAPFLAHLPTAHAVIETLPGTIVPTPSGFRAIGFIGDEPVIHQYDQTGQITSTIHLATLPGHTLGVSQFSDDGLWVKGLASTPTNPSFAVYWNLQHPEQLLTEAQLGTSSRPSFSTATASADGRVVARSSESSTWANVAIQVDGTVHEIRDGNGAPIVGHVDRLFAGVGGVATRWIAVGQYVRSGPVGDYSEHFIAFSDGTFMPLWAFAQEQGQGDIPFSPFYTNVAIGSGSILFVQATYTSPPCSSEGICGNALIPSGYAITALPLPDKWVQSPLNIDGDGQVVPADALALINYLNEHGSGPSANPLGIHSRYDIDDDGFVTPHDALLVIDFINASQSASATTGTVGFPPSQGEPPTVSLMNDLVAASGEEALQRSHRRRLLPSLVLTGIS